MGLERVRPDERGVSEMYGTLLIVSLAFAVSVLLVGFGFFLLDDSLNEGEDRIAEDSVTEFDQRVTEVLEGTSNRSAWQPPPGTEDRFETSQRQGELTVHVETVQRYWNASTAPSLEEGALVDSRVRERTHSRQFGTLVYEAEDGTRTAYQGGAVFEKQGESVSVEQGPPIQVTDGLLRFGVVDISSFSQVSGEELQIQRRSSGGNEIQEAIEDSLRREGDVVAESRVELTIESEFAEGWAAYAESEIDRVDEGDITFPAENRVRIDLGTFGDGIDVTNRSEPPVIYSGAAEFAPHLHNRSLQTIDERTTGPGFRVIEEDDDEYMVGLYKAVNETSDYAAGVYSRNETRPDEPRSWWVWNGSAGPKGSGAWVNIERSNEDVRPIDPLIGNTERFPNGFGTYDVDDETVTCVVDTSGTAPDFGDLVDDPG